MPLRKGIRLSHKTLYNFSSVSKVCLTSKPSHPLYLLSPRGPLPFPPPSSWGHHIYAAQMLSLQWEWQVPVQAHSCGQKSLLISNEGWRTHSEPCPNSLWTEIPSESFSTGKERWTLSEPKWSHQEKVLPIKIAWQELCKWLCQSHRLPWRQPQPHAESISTRRSAQKLLI